MGTFSVLRSFDDETWVDSTWNSREAADTAAALPPYFGPDPDRFAAGRSAAKVIEGPVPAGLVAWKAGV